jgi:chemotaxis protein MotB
MSKSEYRVVIKRKAQGSRREHYGGGWKIAYADFMTAMMAFFLVMWLLSISSKAQLQGIAEQFKMPLQVAVSGGQKSSTSTSVIPGGGTDPTHADGEVNQGDADGDGQRLDQLKKRLDDVIDSNPDLRQLRPQLLIDITPEGLRIQIVDSRNRPMFELASARVLPHMHLILHQIGPVLNELPNKITLSGHTDATQYSGGSKSYSNWELSADRANASRRELIAGGMHEERVLRVMGLASGIPLNKTDPADPMNRRISIVVLNHEAQDRIEREAAAASVAAASRERAVPAGAGAVAPLLQPARQPAGKPVAAP